MRIKLISIGKTNEKYLQEGILEYRKRLRKYAQLEWVELPNIRKSVKLSANELKLKEGEVILKEVKDRDRVFLLDENGLHYSSREFAKFLNKQFTHFSGDLVFVVGGAYGFSEEVMKRSEGKVSLSKMTFSHQMIRVFFAEQVYRAFTILRGEPYHND